METYKYTTWHGDTYEIERYSKENRAELLERVRNGNDKLMTAWHEICKMSGTHHDTELQKWFKAQDKLVEYCTQLKLLGYCNCLYIEQGKKTKSCLDCNCIVCPSTVNYWETELTNKMWDGMGRTEEKRSGLVKNNG